MFLSRYSEKVNAKTKTQDDPSFFSYIINTVNNIRENADLVTLLSTRITAGKTSLP